MRIGLLGELTIELDGRPVQAPRSRPVRALLGWLALHEGLHPRAVVAARLWPDVLDSSARASLRTTLHALRLALGEAGGGRLVATRDAVGLRGELWVDVRAFGELAAAGRLEEALALGRRGELLGGLDDEWVLGERERHREAVLDVLERLAAAAQAGGDVAGALRWTREQTALDPLSEERHRALMERLAAGGDRAAALAVFERLAERLRAELRIAPSAPTRALAERLRAAPAPAVAPAPPSAPPPLPPAFARRRRSAFVGRAPELALLRAALATVRDGERRLVALGGEPGIGKTRLLGEFAREAHGGGAVVLFGRCAEEPLAPYQPFAEALRPLGARVPPELTAGLPVDSDGPAGARWRLFEAVGELLRTSAGDRPLVLALDDLHWADRPTLALVAHLVGAAEPAPLLVLSTHRSSELVRGHPLARLLADLGRDELVERIDLEGLDRAQVGELLEEWAGAAGGGPPAEELLGQTEGNPFYVEQLLRQFVETGAVGPVPDSVKDVIGQRLARLGDGPVRVLAAAAVAGREFDLHVLERLPELAGEDVLATVERALVAQLVREEPGSASGYGFAHALIRQTLYEELSAARRARLHGAIADALGQLGGGAAELAHHRLAAAAGRADERAAQAAFEAARAAAGQLAYEDAAAWYERGAAALPDAAATPRRGAILLALGAARQRAGDGPAARVAFGQAAAIARSAGDPQLLARAALGYSGLGVTIIDVDEESVALLREALAAVGEEGAHAARLVARLAVETYYASRPDERKTLGDRAVALARAANDDGALIDALNARHVALWSAAYLDERLQTAREIVALAERAGDDERALQGHNWLVLDHAERGDLVAMADEVDRHEKLAAALRLPSYQWWGPMWRSTLALAAGRVDEAIALCERFTAIGRRAHDANAALYGELQRLGCALAQEDYREFDDAMLEHQAGRAVEAAYRAGYAWVFAGGGDAARAREMIDWVCADRLARLPDDMNLLAALCELTQACVLLGDARYAGLIYERLAPYGDRNVVNARAAAGYGSARLHLADLAALRGDGAAAAAHYETALDANAAMGARVWLARTRLHYGRWLLAHGDDRRARELLADASADADELGLARLAARVRELGADREG